MRLTLDNILHTAYVFALPFFVWWSAPSAVVVCSLVLFSYLQAWGLALSKLLATPPTSKPILETISASHFAEKVRWCLDRLDSFEYIEEVNCGTLSVIFRALSVPRLLIRTGFSTSVIANSSDILRYVYITSRPGSAVTDRLPASFLEPKSEAIQLEAQLDKQGRYLQLWAYSYALQLRNCRTCLRVWGLHDARIPAWQKAVLVVAYPLLRIFMMGAFPASQWRTGRPKMEAFLGDMETILQDGRTSLLGPGCDRSYVDYTFAAIFALWVRPPLYGGKGGIGGALSMEHAPAAMLADMAAWRKEFPRVTAFVERLYAEERCP
ncbi:unnamed protein product [Phaeothamnion confervicola]